MRAMPNATYTQSKHIKTNTKALGNSPSGLVWKCGAHDIDLANGAIVMGILNITGDSFSDGGQFLGREKAIGHAMKMVEDGATIIDIGGESTRPGAQPVPEAIELGRVLPIVEALVAHGIIVSVDTQKPAVMKAVIAAGAAIINDVNALQTPGALESCAQSNVGVCLMHRQGDSQTMQQSPTYTDVAGEVKAFLLDRTHACELHGIGRERIAIDQGFGFGKTLEHNLALLRAVDEFASLGYPLLVGVSRKSMFKTLLNRDVNDRLAGSLAAAICAAQAGAKILRVHDVAQTVDAIKVLAALQNIN